MPGSLGCIPSKWDNRNLKYIVRAPTFDEYQTIPEEYDGLASYVNCLGSQGQNGTCCGWAGAVLMKTLISLNDKRDILPSAGSIYGRSRKYNNPIIPDTQDGSYPLSVMKVLQKEGCTTELCSPTDIEKPFELKECNEADNIAADYKISSYHSVPTDPASMKAAIYGITFTQPYKMNDGSPGKCPLYVAIPVTNNFYNVGNSGIVSLPIPNEYIIGYHAVVIRGWKKIDNQEYWIVVNSWGIHNGDKGIYYLPIGYTISEAWMVTDDNSLAPLPKPIPPDPLPVPPEPLPKPPQPTPSKCFFGNGIAKILNIVFAQKLRKRQGRFLYMNV